jgi:DMSO/TMAO reductase YedYZ heme-binding membrane subunit
VLALVWAPVAVLAAGAIREALVATRVLALGTTPGDDPPGQALVFAAIVAMLVGAVAWPMVGPDVPRALRPSLALAAGAFAIAHFLAYDPYYLPTLRRYSDGGAIGASAAAAAGAGVLAASLAALRWRRAGVVLTAAATLVVAAMVVMMGGH